MAYIAIICNSYKSDESNLLIVDSFNSSILNQSTIAAKQSPLFLCFNDPFESRLISAGVASWLVSKNGDKGCNVTFAVLSSS